MKRILLVLAIAVFSFSAKSELDVQIQVSDYPYNKWSGFGSHFIAANEYLAWNGNDGLKVLKLEDGNYQKFYRHDEWFHAQGNDYFMQINGSRFCFLEVENIHQNKACVPNQSTDAAFLPFGASVSAKGNQFSFIDDSHLYQFSFDGEALQDFQSIKIFDQTYINKSIFTSDLVAISYGSERNALKILSIAADDFGREIATLSYDSKVMGFDFISETQMIIAFDDNSVLVLDLNTLEVLQTNYIDNIRHQYYELKVVNYDIQEGQQPQGWSATGRAVMLQSFRGFSIFHLDQENHFSSPIEVDINVNAFAVDGSDIVFENQYTFKRINIADLIVGDFSPQTIYSDVGEFFSDVGDKDAFPKLYGDKLFVEYSQMQNQLWYTDLLDVNSTELKFSGNASTWQGGIQAPTSHRWENGYYLFSDVIEVYEFDGVDYFEKVNTLPLHTSPYINGRSITEGDYLYLTDYGSTLYVVDISERHHPVIEGQISFPERASGSGHYRFNDINFSDGRVYLSSEGGFLHAVDVTDPQNPILKKTIRTHHNDSQIGLKKLFVFNGELFSHDAFNLYRFSLNSTSLLENTAIVALIELQSNRQFFNQNYDYCYFSSYPSALFQNYLIHSCKVENNVHALIYDLEKFLNPRFDFVKAERQALPYKQLIVQDGRLFNFDDRGLAEITIVANQPPVIYSDNFIGTEGDDTLSDVIEFDDPENDQLSIFIVEGPKLGFVHIKQNGEFTYTRDLIKVSQDSFVVGVEDSQGNQVTKRLWLNFFPAAVEQPVIDFHEKQVKGGAMGSLPILMILIMMRRRKTSFRN